MSSIHFVFRQVDRLFATVTSFFYNGRVTNMGFFARSPIGFDPGNFTEVQLRIKYANLFGSQKEQLVHRLEVAQKIYRIYLN